MLRQRESVEGEVTRYKSLSFKGTGSSDSVIVDNREGVYPIEVMARGRQSTTTNAMKVVDYNSAQYPSGQNVQTFSYWDPIDSMTLSSSSVANEVLEHLQAQIASESLVSLLRDSYMKRLVLFPGQSLLTSSGFTTSHEVNLIYRELTNIEVA